MSDKSSKEYPSDYELEELYSKIKKHQKSVTNHAPNQQSIDLATGYSLLVEMGQSELMLRVQRDLKNEISELKENNRKAGNWNKGLSICTIILAGLTIWTSFQTLDYSKSDQVSDEIWKQQQIETLKTNNEELKEINQNLKQIIIAQSSDSTSQ